MHSSAPLHLWEWLSRLWSRLHLDYAGPSTGKMFVVEVDAHSKWLNVYPMDICMSTATVEKLPQSFAVHGLPETVVTNSGTCFTRHKFSMFMRHNGVRHIKSAPCHPSTHDLAETAVQTLKQETEPAFARQGHITILH